MFTKFFRTAVIFAVFFAFASAFAQPRKEVRVLRTDSRDKIEERLNLSEKQKEDFYKIQTEQKKAALDIRSQIQKNRADIRLMLKTGKIDDKKLIELTETNSRLQGDLKKSQVRMWLDIYQMLDEKQKELWLEYFDGRGHMGMRMPRGKRDMLFEGSMWDSDPGNVLMKKFRFNGPDFKWFDKDDTDIEIEIERDDDVKEDEI